MQRFALQLFEYDYCQLYVNDNEWFYDIIVTTMNEMIYSSIA